MKDTQAATITGQQLSSSANASTSNPGRLGNRKIYILGAALTAAASAVSGLGIYALVLTSPLWLPPTMAFFATPAGWGVAGGLITLGICVLAYELFHSDEEEEEGKGEKPEFFSKPMPLEHELRHSKISDQKLIEDKYRNPNITDEELKEVKQEIGTRGKRYLEDDKLYPQISVALHEIEEIEKKREEEAEKLSASG